MPVPFGFSVGDFISVCILIKDAIRALDSSRGSSAEYQEVIRELWALDRALLEVVNLAQSFETTVELSALSSTVRRTAEQCKSCIEGFLCRIKEYEGALREGGSGNKLRDVKGKICWALCGQEYLGKFRAEINGHSSAINMLLITASVSLTKLNDKNMEEQIERSRRANEETSNEQSIMLEQMKITLDENTSSLQAQGSTTARLAERMKYFFGLGAELKAFMARIWTLNFRNYNILLDLQSRVPREFGPCWIQEPLILTDALGRVAPVHLELINSWDVLESVLTARFRNIPGEQKISRKEYTLQDRSSSQDIERTAPFEASFFPGRKVDMSMVFSQGNNANLTSCPGCGMESGRDGGTAFVCKGCGIWFQRIEEIVEYQLATTSPQPASSPYFAKPEKHPKGTSPQPPMKKRKLEASNFEEDMSFYKRVRLLHRKYVGLPRTHDIMLGDNQSFRRRDAPIGSGSSAWTVHISLLPSSYQPFPFEKDTIAYKRCLSRGLHQIIVIPDSGDLFFKTSVDEAFSEILRGRPWQPLVAKICDAKNLRGLPMLRQLPGYLLSSNYNTEFLQRNCAVVDESGNILDLYIAMSIDTISWAELKEISPFKPGLEASWTYDPYLDGPCLDAFN